MYSHYNSLENVFHKNYLTGRQIALHLTIYIKLERGRLNKFNFVLLCQQFLSFNQKYLMTAIRQLPKEWSFSSCNKTAIGKISPGTLQHRKMMEGYFSGQKCSQSPPLTIQLLQLVRLPQGCSLTGHLARPNESKVLATLKKPTSNKDMFQTNV